MCLSVCVCVIVCCVVLLCSVCCFAVLCCAVLCCVVLLENIPYSESINTVHCNLRV
jgi:hypothetical protein